MTVEDKVLRQEVIFRKQPRPSREFAVTFAVITHHYRELLECAAQHDKRIREALAALYGHQGADTQQTFAEQVFTLIDYKRTQQIDYDALLRFLNHCINTHKSTLPPK